VDVDPTDFPFLGTEPIAIEFANTDYGLGSDRVDFLRTPALVEEWFVRAQAMLGVVASPSALGRNGRRVRSLRDAVRTILAALADGSMPASTAIGLVNEATAAVPTFLRLQWPPGGAPTVDRLDAAGGSTAALGRIATSCLELVADRHTRVLKHCESPDCCMLFVQHHAHRRFCHPSCGHRGRQARYYRRHPTRGTS
jgi:predicted RNA-binding Zn ribbon-like protein